jgi:hypothetical protein
MPLNLYNYYTGPHLVGDDYQSEIPVIAYQRMRSQVKSSSRKLSDEEQQTLRRYKPTIMKDPDLAAEFAFMYLGAPLYGNEEKFVAANARDLTNLIRYMEKFGVNDDMRKRIEQDGTISDRMKYAERIFDLPLDSEYNERILKAPSMDVALYAAQFEGKKYSQTPASFWERARERILTDVTATAVFLAMIKKRWAAGEELLMQEYAANPNSGALIRWAVGEIAKGMKNPSDADDLTLRMRQIDNKREHQN